MSSLPLIPPLLLPLIERSMSVAAPPPPLVNTFMPPVVANSLGGLGFKAGLRPATVDGPDEDVEGEEERGAGAGGSGGRGGVMDRSVTDTVI